MVSWKRTNYRGICPKGDPIALDSPYNAGRLDDVLPIGGGPILVAAPFSGVWNTSNSTAPAFNFTEWFPKPNMSALAQGIHGATHAFAGGDALYETDTLHDFPLANWRRISTTSIGRINDILVLKNHRRLVLACDNGIFWSGIPDAGGSYAFSAASISMVRFSSLAEGPNESVIVAVWGSKTLAESGIYHGKFVTHHQGVHRPTVLEFQKATRVQTHNPHPWRSMAKMSLASMSTNKHYVFAVAGYERTGEVYETLKSTDGGITWMTTGNEVFNEGNSSFWRNASLTGAQQRYNNCIAVAPSATSLDAITVVVGWSQGYFVSRDSGQLWRRVNADSDFNTHVDFHAIAFDPDDTSNNTLLLCSDGGLAITPDLGRTHTSLGNHQLPNILVRRLTASRRDPGVIAASLQDNGDVYCSLDSTTTQAWKTLEGSDGVGVLFMDNGRLLHYDSTEIDNGIEVGNRVRDAFYNSTSETFIEKQYFNPAPLPSGVIPVDGQATDGYAPWGYGPPNASYIHSFLDTGRDAVPIGIITAPSFKNTRGETMVAVAARGPTPSAEIELYGLFQNTASDIHWTRLGSGPAQTPTSANPLLENVVSVASFDGYLVWVGTSRGRILEFVPRTRTNPNWTMFDKTPAGNTEAILQFVTQDDQNAYAIGVGTKLFETKLDFPSPGSLVLTWRTIPGPSTGENYMAIAMDLNAAPMAVYVATDSKIWVSSDGAKSWEEISGEKRGLPAVPHAMDLAVVKINGNRGGKWLYLGTYGWGVYRTEI